MICPGAEHTFWQQVAARYWCNPYVGFELFNEPGVPVFAGLKANAATG